MKADKNTEFDRFQDALRGVLSVSHEDLKRMIEQEKQANAGKPKRGPKPKTGSARLN